eukprot:gene1169-689_t
MSRELLVMVLLSFGVNSLVEILVLLLEPVLSMLTDSVHLQYGDATASHGTTRFLDLFPDGWLYLAFYNFSAQSNMSYAISLSILLFLDLFLLMLTLYIYIVATNNCAIDRLFSFVAPAISATESSLALGVEHYIIIIAVSTYIHTSYIIIIIIISFQVSIERRRKRSTSGILRDWQHCGTHTHLDSRNGPVYGACVLAFCMSGDASHPDPDVAGKVLGRERRCGSRISSSLAEGKMAEAIAEGGACVDASDPRFPPHEQDGGGSQYRRKKKGDAVDEEDEEDDEDEEPLDMDGTTHQRSAELIASHERHEHDHEREGPPGWPAHHQRHRRLSLQSAHLTGIRLAPTWWQLVALLQKNLRHRWRHPISAIMEVFVPLCFALFLLVYCVACMDHVPPIDYLRSDQGDINGNLYLQVFCTERTNETGSRPGFNGPLAGLPLCEEELPNATAIAMAAQRTWEESEKVFTGRHLSKSTWRFFNELLREIRHKASDPGSSPLESPSVEGVANVGLDRDGGGGNTTNTTDLLPAKYCASANASSPMLPVHGLCSLWGRVGFEAYLAFYLNAFEGHPIGIVSLNPIILAQWAAMVVLGRTVAETAITQFIGNNPTAPPYDRESRSTVYSAILNAGLLRFAPAENVPVHLISHLNQSSSLFRYVYGGIFDSVEAAQLEAANDTQPTWAILQLANFSLGFGVDIAMQETSLPSIMRPINPQFDGLYQSNRGDLYLASGFVYLQKELYTFYLEELKTTNFFHTSYASNHHPFLVHFSTLHVNANLVLKEAGSLVNFVASVWLYLLLSFFTPSALCFLLRDLNDLSSAAAHFRFNTLLLPLIRPRLIAVFLIFAADSRNGVGGERDTAADPSRATAIGVSAHPPSWWAAPCEPSRWVQLRAMFVKRWCWALRDGSFHLVTMLSPMVVMVCGFLLSVMKPTSTTTVDFSVALYEMKTALPFAEDCIKLLGWASEWDRTVPPVLHVDSNTKTFPEMADYLSRTYYSHEDLRYSAIQCRNGTTWGDGSKLYGLFYNSSSTPSVVLTVAQFFHQVVMTGLMNAGASVEFASRPAAEQPVLPAAHHEVVVEKGSWLQSVRFFFWLVPSFSMGDAVVQLLSVDPKRIPDPSPWSMGVIGWPCIYMAAEIPVWAILLWLLEHDRRPVFFLRLQLWWLRCCCPMLHRRLGGGGGGSTEDAAERESEEDPVACRPLSPLAFHLGNLVSSSPTHTQQHPAEANTGSAARYIVDLGNDKLDRYQERQERGRRPHRRYRDDWGEEVRNTVDGRQVPSAGGGGGWATIPHALQGNQLTASFYESSTQRGVLHRYTKQRDRRQRHLRHRRQPSEGGRSASGGGRVIRDWSFETNSRRLSSSSYETSLHSAASWHPVVDSPENNTRFDGPSSSSPPPASPPAAAAVQSPRSAIDRNKYKPRSKEGGQAAPHNTQTTPSSSDLGGGVPHTVGLSDVALLRDGPPLPFTTNGSCAPYGGLTRTALKGALLRSPVSSSSSHSQHVVQEHSPQSTLTHSGHTIVTPTQGQPPQQGQGGAGERAEGKAREGGGEALGITTPTPGSQVMTSASAVLSPIPPGLPLFAAASSSGSIPLQQQPIPSSRVLIHNGAGPTSSPTPPSISLVSARPTSHATATSAHLSSPSHPQQLPFPRSPVPGENNIHSSFTATRTSASSHSSLTHHTTTHLHSGQTWTLPSAHRVPTALLSSPLTTSASKLVGFSPATVRSNASAQQHHRPTHHRLSRDTASLGGGGGGGGGAQRGPSRALSPYAYAPLPGVRSAAHHLPGLPAPYAELLRPLPFSDRSRTSTRSRDTASNHHKNDDSAFRPPPSSLHHHLSTPHAGHHPQGGLVRSRHGELLRLNDADGVSLVYDAFPCPNREFRRRKRGDRVASRRRRLSEDRRKKQRSRGDGLEYEYEDEEEEDNNNNNDDGDDAR